MADTAMQRGDPMDNMQVTMLQKLTISASESVAQLADIARADSTKAPVLEAGKRYVHELRKHAGMPAPEECCGDPEHCFAACGDLAIAPEKPR